MSKGLKYVLRSLTLAAGERKRVSELASFFMLVSNTGTSRIQISIDDDPLSDFPTGDVFRELPGEFFKHIDFRNPNAGSVTIEYVMSSGIVQPGVSLSGDINVTDIADTIETPAALLLNAGNSYKGTITADATQKALEIQNTGAYDCWYGKQDTDVDPAAKRGIKLEVGADKILPINCDLYFKSATVVCTISYMRLKKV